MGDGDLPPLEHVRAGIEAVHDEAEKPPDRQPRASRQGPPRHLRCASTTTVAAAGSRSTGPDMPFALGWSFARCSTAASLSGAPPSPTARCSTSQWGSTASTSHSGQSRRPLSASLGATHRTRGRRVCHGRRSCPSHPVWWWPRRCAPSTGCQRGTHARHTQQQHVLHHRRHNLWALLRAVAVAG
jgi:hypothetical protein